jgi:hypothetical protein
LYLYWHGTSSVEPFRRYWLCSVALTWIPTTRAIVALRLSLITLLLSLATRVATGLRAIAKVSFSFARVVVAIRVGTVDLRPLVDVHSICVAWALCYWSDVVDSIEMVGQ